jgi:hypothetical protein
MDYGKAWVDGNVVEGNDRVTRDNWDGGVQVELPPGFDDDALLARVKARKPYPHSYIDITSAQDAYPYVLENAGAVKPKRDAVDERIVKMVRTGTVTYEQGRGIVTDIKQVGGYPEYKGQPYADADDDGMPDAWENEHKLNPNDPSDAAADANGDGYTNIEDFLNGLDPNAPKQKWETPRTFIDLFWNV